MRLGGCADTIRVYGKEIRSLTRDRHTVIYSIILPVFLYPALVWGTLQSISFVRALEERRISEVAVLDGTGDQRLSRFLEGQPRLKLSRLDDGLADSPGSALRAGQAHAALVYRLEGADSPRRAAHAGIYFDAAREVSTRARDRLLEALKAWRKAEIQAEASMAGEEGDVQDLVEVREENLATSRETSRFTAAMILPIVSIVMLVLGAMYPALETTVGERERGTLETTLVTPTSRGSIVGGKYLAVVTFTLFAFLMNAVSLSFTLYHLSSQMKSEIFSVDLSVSTLLVVLACALLLSAFLGALVMLLAFSARTFKEGQTYLTPVYVLTLAPAMLVASPDTVFGVGLACAPVVNLLFVFREALRGRELGLPAFIAFVVSVLYAGLALRGASLLLRQESYVAGGESPGGFAFLSRFRWASRGSAYPRDESGST